MYLDQLANTGFTIKVGRDADGNQYMVNFFRCEVKRDGMLEGFCGYGDTVEAAAYDYITQISGKTLVYDAYGGERKEFQIFSVLMEE